jgi:hypothetical protein
MALWYDVFFDRIRERICTLLVKEGGKERLEEPEDWEYV